MIAQLQAVYAITIAHKAIVILYVGGVIQFFTTLNQHIPDNQKPAWLSFVCRWIGYVSTSGRLSVPFFQVAPKPASAATDLLFAEAATDPATPIAIKEVTK